MKGNPMSIYRQNLVRNLENAKKLEEELKANIMKALEVTGYNDHTFLRLYNMAVFNTLMAEDALSTYDKRPTFKKKFKKLFKM